MAEEFREPSPEDKLQLPNIEVDAETLEKYKELNEVMEDAVDGLKELVGPGGQFFLHPLDFETTSDYDPEADPIEDEIRRKVVLNYAFEKIGFDPQNSDVAYQNDQEGFEAKFFKTGIDGILLGFDGRDFILEMEQAPEEIMELIEKSFDAGSAQLRVLNLDGKSITENVIIPEGYEDNCFYVSAQNDGFVIPIEIERIKKVELPSEENVGE